MPIGQDDLLVSLIEKILDGLDNGFGLDQTRHPSQRSQMHLENVGLAIVDGGQHRGAVDVGVRFRSYARRERQRQELVARRPYADVGLRAAKEHALQPVPQFSCVTSAEDDLYRLEVR